MVTVDQVLNSLKKVVDPELHKDIVSMGMIKDLSINDGKVAFTLELTTPACPFNSDIERDVRAAMAGLGVKDLNMRVTARVMEGRALSMDELLPGVKNIVAVASGKGGVGKTTVSVNLALALAKTGAKVGLLDSDIYGPSVPLMLGLKASPEVVNNKIQPPEIGGIKVISMGFFYEQSQQAGIYRGPIVSGIVKQFLTDVNWGELDYLIIDLPPGTGDAPLTIAQTIPITGVVENMSYLQCPHCSDQIYLFGQGGGKKISDEFQIPFIGEIPLHPRIREGSDIGKPAVVSEPESMQAHAFSKAAKMVAGRISIIAAEMKAQEQAEGNGQDKKEQ